MTESFEIKQCSTEFLILLDKKRMKAENPLPDRITRYPLHKLAVGQALFVDVDIVGALEMRSIRIAVKRYNAIHKDLFVVKKHRGDLRKTGYRYIEIVRVK